MGSELTFRGGHEAQPASDSYSPKLPKRWASVTRPIGYLLREQRLIFVLVGIAIATVGFTLLPSSRPSYGHGHGHNLISNEYVRYDFESSSSTHKPVHERRFGLTNYNSGGKVPLGLKRKGLRIVVTGGAGFVGSHLVDRLMQRGDSVIVVDNFFTGRKENVQHHFGNPRFELIRHDVVEPLLLEVDQIYHLACPASPVHYKFNPVKTIKTNVVGTLNMLGLAKRVGARFLLTSTSEVYGDPLQHPQVETYWGNVNPIGQFLFLFLISTSANFSGGMRFWSNVRGQGQAPPGVVYFDLNRSLGRLVLFLISPWHDATTLALGPALGEPSLEPVGVYMVNYMNTRDLRVH